MRIKEIFYSTITNKCPRCHEGRIFEKNNPYAAGSFKMREECSECGLKYTREPGFFYGAMYVSYALMTGILVFWLLLDMLWLHADPLVLVGIVAVNMVVLFPVAFRWSRMIWLNLFVKYDKSYSHKAHVHS